MTMPDILDTLAATWPAESTRRLGPWTIRQSQGGGKRAMAATADAPVTPADLDALESAQSALGQPALVMLRTDDAALDALLAARGYAMIDPVLAYAAPVAHLTADAPQRLSGITHWPRLAITDEIWAEGGIRADRLAVMDRATTAKAAILGRAGDLPAGAAYVAAHGTTAMIHAIEVRTRLRRQGCARNMLRTAAVWSQDVGATAFSLLVHEQNTAARALYASLGMDVVGEFHYRMK